MQTEVLALPVGVRGWWWRPETGHRRLINRSLSYRFRFSGGARTHAPSAAAFTFDLPERRENPPSSPPPLEAPNVAIGRWLRGTSRRASASPRSHTQPMAASLPTRSRLAAANCSVGQCGPNYGRRCTAQAVQ
jgi:hypothetical protein